MTAVRAMAWVGGVFCAILAIALLREWLINDFGFVLEIRR